MDTLTKYILDSSNFDEWLKQNGLGWLMEQRFIEAWSTVIGAIIAYYIGRVLLKWGIKSVVRSTAKHRDWHKKDIEKRQETLIQLLRSFWRILMIAYALAVVANKLFLVDLSPLFASAGIIGVALGFGAQSLVKDFLAGIFIIAENQYRVGDVVDIMGAVGKVERVGTRSTVVRDTDGNVHYIPNGTIQQVINKTMGYSMARFTLAVAPDTDIDKVAKIIDKIGLKLASEEKWKDKVLEAPRYVMMGEFTATAINLIVSGKTQPSDQWSVTAEMRRRILEKFDQEGIEIGTIPVIPTTPKKK